MARRLWLPLMVSLTLVLALGFAACGGDDDAGGVADTAGTGTPEATANGTGGNGDGGPTETADAGSDGSSADPGFGICGLLTEGEVSDALGANVSAGEEFDYDPFFDCQWTTGNFDYITVTVAKRDAGESLYNFSNEDAVKVDGVGDAAQYSFQLFSSLEVLVGDYYFSVSVSASELETDQVKAVSIDLARRIIDRLP